MLVICPCAPQREQISFYSILHTMTFLLFLWRVVTDKVRKGAFHQPHLSI